MDVPESTPRVGVLLCNLGTPDAPTASALRRYLAEFLWDRRVVEAPRPLWWLVLNGIILRVRPKKSARAYQRVWTDAGSPLLVISREQAAALEADLSERLPQTVKVVVGMRYGNPSIAAGLTELQHAGCERILVLPMFPQYSGATNASVLDAVGMALRKVRKIPELRMIRDFHNDPGYLDALAQSIRRHWETHSRAQKLLFSFHGIPESYALKGDPYPEHCVHTARELATRLGLEQDAWMLVYQSRFGLQRWLTPYADKTLEALPGQGIKQVDVVCPGFSADCLETIDEMALENKEVFLEAGGEDYRYIPALNAHPDHISALGDLVVRHLGGWVEPRP
ncbi:MAG: ferrochelatase [Aquisalimonadaceae bacterium]